MIVHGWLWFMFVHIYKFRMFFERRKQMPRSCAPKSQTKCIKSASPSICYSSSCRCNSTWCPANNLWRLSFSNQKYTDNYDTRCFPPPPTVIIVATIKNHLRRNQLANNNKTSLSPPICMYHEPKTLLRKKPINTNGQSWSVCFSNKLLSQNDYKCYWIYCVWA